MLILGFFIISNNSNNNQNNLLQKNTNVDLIQMMDCGKLQNPNCFSDRMINCLPVTAELTATDGSTRIDLTILGIENETCHFQRKVSGILNLECYFPLGKINWDLIDQTFGNDKGLQSTVDTSCKAV